MSHQSLSAAAVRPIVWDRQLGTCAGCHRGLHHEAWHAHHRQSRKHMGWCPCNIVALHPNCHVVAPEAAHQRPAWAREVGLIVPSWADTRERPVLLHVPWSGSLYLWCDGTVSSSPDPELQLDT